MRFSSISICRRKLHLQTGLERIKVNLVASRVVCNKILPDLVNVRIDSVCHSWRLKNRFELLSVEIATLVCVEIFEG